MKSTKYYVLMVVFLLLCTAFTACKSTSAVLPQTNTDSTSTKAVEIKIHDTILQTKPDSSYYKAYLERVNGMVVLSQKSKVETQAGNYLKPPRVHIKDNILQVDCQAESQKLFAQWKEMYTKENHSVIKKIPYSIEKQLSWWQKTQMIAGDIFLIILILFIVVIALRLTSVIKI